MTRVRVGRFLAAAVALVVVTGCGMGGDEDAAYTAEPPAPVTTADPAVEEPGVPSGDEPEGEPTPSVTPTTRRPTAGPKPTKAAAKPRPTRKKTVPVERPPAPKPKTTKPGCKPSYKGTKQGKAQVRAALEAAAAGQYWPKSAPDLRIPLTVVQAVAWQESGWQANIYACDGGVGLMQVMPATAADVNQFFAKSYDIDAYQDNAKLGANYLAWITYYLGEEFFDGSYSLDPADCDGNTDLCLLNMVIAAYNQGIGAVQRAVPSGKLPNGQAIRYADNVRSLMVMKPWA